MLTADSLYKKHIEQFPNDKYVLMFGYTANEILIALKKTYEYPIYEKRNNQMTREEAYKRLQRLDYDTNEGINYDLKVLEALGLIKFEEKAPTCIAFKLENYPSGLEIIVGGELIYSSKK